jgi:hypothetical protein
MLMPGAYFGLKRDAAAGVDGITWQEYGQDLEPKLVDGRSGERRL